MSDNLYRALDIVENTIERVKSGQANPSALNNALKIFEGTAKKMAKTIIGQELDETFRRAHEAGITRLAQKIKDMMSGTGRAFMKVICWSCNGTGRYVKPKGDQSPVKPVTCLFCEGNGAMQIEILDEWEE